MNLRVTISTIVAVLLITAGLTSCGSSSNASHLLYVTTGQGIYAYRITNGSGESTSIFTTPFVIGNAPAGIAIDPSDQFAYVANQADNTISLLKIDSVTGTLTEVLPRTQAGFSPHDLVIDPSGTTLFVANQLSNDLSTFSIGSGGSLSLVSTTQLGSTPTSLAFSNGLLFVGVPNFSNVYVFAVSSGNLAPVAGSPFLVSNGIGSVTVDPAGKFLYVPNPGAETISAFSIQANGSLTAVPGSPFAPTASTAPVGPVAAAADATSTHLYVANFGSSSVSQFSIGTNGSLASLIPATASVSTNPAFVVFDPVGKYLFVGNVGSNSVSEMDINSDATLGASTSISVPTVPQAIALTK
jgi:6-phosphogluconolactonase (cycloisomerase 2 family)